MKTMKQPFILFFVAGMVPTAAELAEAGKLRARVGYRNASVVNDEDAPEPCDGVAGAVPKPYRKYPSAADAIAAYDKRLEDAAKAADAAVGVPPSAKSPGPSTGVPKGFEGLPGGDGSIGAPAAPAGDGKPADSKPAAPANPTDDANKKPPAWGGGKK